MQNSEIQKLQVAAAFKKHNGVLPDAPDGPIIPRFNARELARAIESELNRARLMGWSKISIHLDVIDAVALMVHLRDK